MVIVCSTCGAKYKFDESKLGGATSKRIKCPKCRGVIEIVNQSPDMALTMRPQENPAMDHTSPAESLSDKAGGSGEPPRTSQVKKEELHESYLKMPDNSKISLAVIQGNNSGEIFPVSKAQMIIGRSNADITIRDPEASRSHAELAVMGERIILRDLNSTNGTYVDEERVESTTLENRSEFRIGSTVFMVIITDLE
jgi:predicted Zn finger-like uncharacterized protein